MLNIMIWKLLKQVKTSIHTPPTSLYLPPLRTKTLKENQFLSSKIFIPKVFLTSCWQNTVTQCIGKYVKNNFLLEQFALHTQILLWHQEESQCSQLTHSCSWVENPALYESACNFPFVLWTKAEMWRNGECHSLENSRSILVYATGWSSSRIVFPEVSYFNDQQVKHQRNFQLSFAFINVKTVPCFPGSFVNIWQYLEVLISLEEPTQSFFLAILSNLV